MKKNGFAPLIIILVIAILGVVGYFAYKNYLVKTQILVVPFFFPSSTTSVTTAEELIMLKRSGFAFQLPDKEWELETQEVNGQVYNYLIGIPNPNYPSKTITYQDKYQYPFQIFDKMSWVKTDADLYPSKDFQIIAQEIFQNQNNVKIHLYSLKYLVKDDSPGMFSFGENLDMAFFQKANGDYVQVYSDEHSMNDKFRKLLQSVIISR